MTSTHESSTGNTASLLRWLGIIAFAGLTIGLLMTVVARSVKTVSPVAEGEGLDAAEVADFRLPSLDGAEIGPPDFGGRVVVVDFWATWCGPCRLQAAYLESMHGEYDADDVQFLAVNVGEDEQTVRAFVDNEPFPYPVLMDEHNVLANRYQVYGLPMLMVIGKDGTISYKKTGVLDKEALGRIIARAGVPVPTTANAA